MPGRVSAAPLTLNGPITQTPAAGVWTNVADAVTTFQPMQGEYWYLFGSWKYINNTGSDLAGVRIVRNPGAGDQKIFQVSQHGGSGNTDVSAGTLVVDGPYGVAPGLQTYQLQVFSNAGQSVSIANVHLRPVRADQYMDAWAIAEAQFINPTTGPNDITGAFVDVVSGATQNFLCFAVADLSGSSAATNPTPTLVIDDGTIVGGASGTAGGVAQIYWGVAYPVSLGAGIHRIKVQVTNAGAIVNNCRLVVVPAQDLDAAYSVAEDTPATTTGTGLVDVTGATVTFVPNNLQHLIVASAAVRIDGGGVLQHYMQTQLALDGVANSNISQMEVFGGVPQCHWIVESVTPTNASHTYKWQMASGTNGDTTRVMGAHIVVMQLDWTGDTAIQVPQSAQLSPKVDTLIQVPQSVQLQVNQTHITSPGGVLPNDTSLPMDDPQNWVLATFETLGICVQWTGDDNRNSSITVQFKKAADSVWRGTLPGFRFDVFWDNVTIPDKRSYMTCALLCAMATGYQVKATFVDPDGVTGGDFISSTSASVTASITTWDHATRVPDISTFSPTKFVDAVNGLDTYDGTAATHTSGIHGPWQTLEAASLGAVDNDRLQVTPGYYVGAVFPQANLWINGSVPVVTNTPVTISGQMREDYVEVNNGNQAIVHDGFLTSPTGSGDVNPGVWKKCDGVGGNPPVLTGETTGHVYSGADAKLWRFSAGSNWRALIYGTFAWSSTKGGQLHRIGVWQPTGGGAPSVSHPGKIWRNWSPQSFVDQTAHCLDYFYGVFVDDTQGWHDPSILGVPGDVYLRLPNDVDPNTVWIWGGLANGIEIDGNGSRVSGIRFDCLTHGVQMGPLPTQGPQPRDQIVDHCLFDVCWFGAYANSDSTVYPSLHPRGLVIERNAFRDSSLNTLTPLSDHTTIPWIGIKGGVTMDDGVSWGLGGEGPLQGSECGATKFEGAPIQSVVQYNTRGVHGHPEYGGHDSFIWTSYHIYDRWMGYLTDVEHNNIWSGHDDALEHGSAMSNWCAVDNLTWYTLTQMSANGVSFGPYFIVRELSWRYGSSFHSTNWGQLWGGNATPIMGGDGLKQQGPNGYIVIGPTPDIGARAPVGQMRFAHNTVWTDSVASITDWHGVLGTVYTGGPYTNQGSFGPKLWLRNDIWIVAAVPFNFAAGAWVDVGYEQWATLSPSNIDYNRVQYNNNPYRTVADFQAVSGSGVGLNPVAAPDGSWRVPNINSIFVDILNGNMLLASGAGVIGKGINLPNISDIQITPTGNVDVDLARGGVPSNLPAPSPGAREYDITAGANPTFSLSSSGIYANSAGNVVPVLGVNTAWIDGVTVFGVAGVAGVSKTSQTIIDATHATITLATGAAIGTATISDNTDAATAPLPILQPTFSLSPSGITASTVGNVLALIGVGTDWQVGVTTFGIAGLEGSSITAQNVIDKNHASITVTAGATLGTATISDDHDTATATLTVNAAPPATMVASQGSIFANTPNQQVPIVGTNTHWDSNTAFLLANVAGALVTNVIIVDATHAVLTIQTSSAIGTATISDTADQATTTIQVVAAPITGGRGYANRTYINRTYTQRTYVNRAIGS